MTPDSLRDLGEVLPDGSIAPNPACWFLDHGVGVFPLKSRSKEPACSSWDDFTCSREQAARFHSYGVRLTSRLGVIDTDDRDDEAWVLGQISTGAIPETPFTVATARGKHRYFRLAGPLPKFLHRNKLTIEFRNIGQYVVGPGSIHPSGVTYAASNWSWRWEDIPFFPDGYVFNDGSCGRISPERTAAAPGEDYEFPEAVHKNFRHHELFRLLRSCKGSGIDREMTYTLVTMANAHRCFPPLVVDKTFDEWFSRGWDNPDRPFPHAAPLQGLRGL